MHGGSCKHRLLGMKEQGFQVASVAQQAVIEVLHSFPEEGGLLVCYACYIVSIHDI